MPERIELLQRLLDAFFVAEFCEPSEKANCEKVRDELLAEVAMKCETPAATLKEALLKKRYPRYRTERLKRELPNTPAALRRN
jgi:hypothetical protein